MSIMTTDQTRIDQFDQYLSSLEPHAAAEVVRKLAITLSKRVNSVMIVGSIANPSDLGKIINSLLVNLCPADQVTAGLALLRVTTNMMGVWFADPAMSDAPGIAKINAQFSAIASQIDRLSAMMTDPDTQPLIDPLPQGSAIAAAAAEIAAMSESEGEAAIEAVAMPHIKKFPGSLLLGEPQTEEQIIEFFAGFLDTQPVTTRIFVSMNMITGLAKSVEQLLSNSRNTASEQSKSEAIAVVRQIYLTMKALNTRAQDRTAVAS